MSGNSQKQPDSRLERLLRFVDADPGNAALLADAATLAFDQGDNALAAELIARHAAGKPLSPELSNLRGLIAINERRYDQAAEIFEGLRAGGHDDPGLRFNLAWVLAMQQRWQDALPLLDEEALAKSPRAPMLKIQVLHHLGRLEEALECGRLLAERFPKDGALLGALAQVCLDAGRADLAADYAGRAGDDAGGQAALGVLALGEQNLSGSIAAFDRALQREPDNARALIGKGLTLLTSGDAAAGARAIDRGAELFRSHIGSWVAAGWAYFLAGDTIAARERFGRALAIDPNFAETHGGIAVIDAAEGKADAAARESEVALRLDRHCFGAALAKAMLLQSRGRPEIARRIVGNAMNTPVGPHGETLGQMLAGLGRQMRPPGA